jgi:hypothetical protein
MFLLTIVATNEVITDDLVNFGGGGHTRVLMIGLIRKSKYRSDLLGIGINWGSPPDDALPEQTTIEEFWNIQIAQNIAVTPDVQLFLDPPLNQEDSSVWVFGLRARLTSLWMPQMEFVFFTTYMKNWLITCICYYVAIYPNLLKV